MTIKANNAWNKKPVYFNASQAGLVIWEGFVMYVGGVMKSDNKILASSVFKLPVTTGTRGSSKSQGRSLVGRTHHL